jgi:hypothetical protein
MTTEPVIARLLLKGLIKKGSILGLRDPKTHRVYNRYVVRAASSEPQLAIEAQHMQNQQTLMLDCNAIVEVDGMEMSRYLAHADLNSNGESINRGKKRGRRPKNRG